MRFESVCTNFITVTPTQRYEYLTKELIVIELDDYITKFEKYIKRRMNWLIRSIISTLGS